MPNEKLDAFLAANTGANAPAEPPQAPEPAPAPATPPPEAKPSTPTPAAPAKAAEPERDENDGLGVTGEDTRTVGFSALEKVRNDWRSKFAAEQARADMLAKQLDEAKRPPPAPQQQPQQQYIPPPPDPRVDPGGWAQHMVMAQQHAELNRNLNTSEWLARDKLGDEAVNAAVAEFKAASEKDPTLWGKLYSQAMPYQWLVKEMAANRARADIGDDPAAYRAKVEAELRAKWEAEQATTAPPVSPAAGLPPSLANVRSVAGRTSNTWTGPTPASEMLSGIPSHMRARSARN